MLHRQADGRAALAISPTARFHPWAEGFCLKAQHFRGKTGGVEDLPHPTLSCSCQYLRARYPGMTRCPGGSKTTTVSWVEGFGRDKSHSMRDDPISHCLSETKPACCIKQCHPHLKLDAHSCPSQDQLTCDPAHENTRSPMPAWPENSSALRPAQLWVENEGCL